MSEKKTRKPIMGRPPEADKKLKMAIYLRSLERERLEVLAQQEGMSKAGLVEKILKKSLNAKFQRNSSELL